ncbi:MAG TPA: NAD(P)H-dependent glycerol-3-phosphate dehydrogenase [Patescibacteria group bacterium]|jgi:glycerol-3-phosphate dehydrogenase (NAD(P)+)|nr:NAD(P)H-dependent glycerol-3-phosphate dehydrogenase [Patescibacteria group bacterium]
MSGQNVAILGAGSLGTALAAGLHRSGRNFSLWTIEDDVAESLRNYRENVKYLPGIKVPREVRIETDLASALEGAGLVIFAVPSHVVREVARRVSPLIAADAFSVSAAKGLERKTLLRMTQVIAEELPEPNRPRIVVMSGPSLAGEVGDGVPTGVDVAALDPEAGRTVKAALTMKRFRIKLRKDVPGVEAGGTFKNLYAIGAGICDGLSLGHNTKAALLTRALSEMILCAKALGGKASTLYGLSGLGDLMVTCTSPRSRNRTLGEHLGRGHKVADISRGMVSVTEGVDAAHCAHELAEKHHLRIPLAGTIYGILNGEMKVESIIKVALP